MTRRKPKPDPVVDLTAAEAEAHARAETVTDPAAFEFPLPPAAGDPVASPPPPRPSDAADGDRPSSEPPSGEDAVFRRARDPFPVAAVTLGPETGSPRVRLFRSDRFKQVAIRFDEKPAEKYLDLLRDAGFKWRADDGVWTKQFDPDARWRTMAEAEALFEKIGNGLRDDLGLPPVRILGG